MNLLEWLKVALLGIVEGITEWLPVSSTGHLIILDEFINLNQSSEFMEMFNVVIQLGAILAVVVVFIRKLWPFHTRKHAVPDYQVPEKYASSLRGSALRFCNNYCYIDKIILWLKIIVACIPAVVLGLFLDDWMQEHFYNAIVVALMLILYGVLFIIVENFNKKRTPRITSTDSLSFRDAFLIGLFQVLSLIPGTSRSGSTILGGILIGTSREVAAEFSFFLAIPVMVGASLLKVVKFGFHFTSTELAVLLVGMAVAFVVSLLAIRFLMDFVRKHTFKGFGWYRICLGVFVLLYFFVIT